MPRNSKADEDILTTARERFKLCEDAEQLIRRDALDDLRFCSGDQWNAYDRQQRTAPGATRTPDFVTQFSTGLVRP